VAWGRARSLDGDFGVASNVFFKFDEYGSLEWVEPTEFFARGLIGAEDGFYSYGWLTEFDYTFVKYNELGEQQFSRWRHK